MDKRYAQSGFSLLELLIAMFLLAIGFFAATAVIWSSSRAGGFSRQMTAAASLGQDMLERANLIGYAGLANTGGFVNYTAFNPQATGFTRQWRIQTNTPSTGLTTVTATISWNDGPGGTKTRTFTLIKRPEY